ncbi:hypothetical protein IBL26_23160 [Roseomonas aerophila]|uniref:Uncharacterized protein n=1 Tax=Teichococcus aerophilus TaxID=1224513 RepID=A0ABR7RUG1_9PROT|nr:hypothetical protein [Pseudoroseomonas aerophila]MBC9209755.1 hypothetical protein [Pseudoroseomonas aerophila]
MTATISARVYEVTFHKKGEKICLPHTSDEFSVPPKKFLESFVKFKSSSSHNSEKERSWRFLEIDKTEGGGSRGHIKYGTFGFESDFVDTQTKKTKFKRGVNDAEEVPLFYEFWLPKNSNKLFFLFQSFQGRSCVQMAMSEMQEKFEEENEGLSFKYQKLLANSLGSSSAGLPVRRLRLIKRGAPSDIANEYFGDSDNDQIDYELSFTARPRKFLGLFSQLMKSMPKETGSVLKYEGLEFNEAYADVRVGRRVRRVGLFGVSSDAGVIDLSDDVERGPNGHPTYESMCELSDGILADFYDAASEA